LEAAVVAVPHPVWCERPLACVVVRPGARVTRDELRDFLGAKVARWWLPDDVVFVPEIPKTSVGKFDKKVLRQRYQGHVLPVDAAPREEPVERPARLRPEARAQPRRDAPREARRGGLDAAPGGPRRAARRGLAVREAGARAPLARRDRAHRGRLVRRVRARQA